MSCGARDLQRSRHAPCWVGRPGRRTSPLSWEVRQGQVGRQRLGELPASGSTADRDLIPKKNLTPLHLCRSDSEHQVLGMGSAKHLVHAVLGSTTGSRDISSVWGLRCGQAGAQTRRTTRQVPLLLRKRRQCARRPLLGHGPESTDAPVSVHPCLLGRRLWIDRLQAIVSGHVGRIFE
jgi:hypothetical protein